MSGIVIASANGKIGLQAAVDVLTSGGSAVDAVIAGTRLVEANPDDHTVGYGGLPNMLGEVELDASIMDGHGLRAGSVGALRGYQDAVDLARRVMDELPHVLIAGDGANRLARELGFEEKELLTPEAEAIWRRRIDEDAEDPQGRDSYLAKVREMVRASAQDPDYASIGEVPHGTVNFIARDMHGNLATAVSTSGWAWKYPGRMGDSPIIGAGNYADNRWGAAACTGRGEMAQRCLTAYSVVTFLRLGMSLEDALKTAIDDLDHLDDPYASDVTIVAMDRHGSPLAASTSADRKFVVQTTEMSEADERISIHVPIGLVSQ